MTHTIQPRSLPISGETGKDLTINEGETEDSLLLSVLDSLKKLSMALNRLDNVQNNLCKKIFELEDIVRNI